MSISVGFQKRLRELSKEGQLNLTNLAKSVKVAPNTLSLALKYGIIPKPSTLALIADFFDVSIQYLLGQTNELFYHKADQPATFHERLQELCKEKNITSYKLAKECHFDKSSISAWYRKNQTPAWDLFELLTDYFNVSPDYLLGRTDDKN